MRRMVLYCIALCAALVIPQRGTDIGKLQPVEVVLLDSKDGEMIIQTDTKDEGRGISVEQALQNLKDTTPGTVFLDTADYLIITEESMESVEKMKPYLDASVLVCKGTGEEDLEAAARYLAVHKPRTTLKNAELSTDYQLLSTVDGRMNLS